MLAVEERKMPLEDGESEITCLRRELEASLATNGSLEKENQELRQEVSRLKAQITSLKAHDNERKSILWKKLQNSIESGDPDSSQLKSSDIVKPPVLKSSDIQEFATWKEIPLKAPKPPPGPAAIIFPSPKEVNGNKIEVNGKKIKAPAPPPPPLPSKLLAGSRSVRRVPEVVELYRSLMRKDGQLENKTNPATTPTVAFSKIMIGEIENRSSYVSAIKSDVQKQKAFINFLIKEVESLACKEISDVELFVKWLDQELSSLVDERAVLKHFPQWPERKADALREAAFSYRDLRSLESEVSSFEANPKDSLTQALRRMQTLQDSLEQSVSRTERMRESSGKRYRDFHIPCEWMLDTGIIGQLKLSSLRLAKEYMKRITKALSSNQCSQEDNLLLQGVRFSYRIHQFAGGFDAEAIHAFEDLKKISMNFHISN
ncbi:hypothetical protein SLEP1_g13885 [Rubroshorea leprosula]|uniref:Protein CHUP1, chloroplastic n=1 Tax=Rubroshorea leprosula TaxID=152421 RepID=A0AAV5IHB3_9ROSI|nr:hypothetical protein SLEP1_g13885 [Rubroshorea leprosula]